MTFRLAWASDLHLDHCSFTNRYEFAADCRDRSDAMVITGDITSGKEIHAFVDFAYYYTKPVHFVLGNHDFWWRSFDSVREEYRRLDAIDDRLTFLDVNDAIDIAPGVQLCGHSGWYDAQLGNQESPIALNDWRLISDLDALRVPFELGEPLRNKFRQLANESAYLATEKLATTTAPHVIFATHIPPFAEAAWHEGKQSDWDCLPYYTNAAMGHALNRFATRNPERKLTTLCGHSHSSGTYQAAENHVVRTAAAEYGKPAVEWVFELEGML